MAIVVGEAPRSTRAGATPPRPRDGRVRAPMHQCGPPVSLSKCITAITTTGTTRPRTSRSCVCKEGRPLRDDHSPAPLGSDPRLLHATGVRGEGLAPVLARPSARHRTQPLIVGEIFFLISKSRGHSPSRSPARRGSWADAASRAGTPRGEATPWVVSTRQGAARRALRSPHALARRPLDANARASRGRRGFPHVAALLDGRGLPTEESGLVHADASARGEVAHRSCRVAGPHVRHLSLVGRGLVLRLRVGLSQLLGLLSHPLRGSSVARAPAPGAYRPGWRRFCHGLQRRCEGWPDPAPRAASPRASCFLGTSRPLGVRARSHPLSSAHPSCVVAQRDSSLGGYEAGACVSRVCAAADGCEAGGRGGLRPVGPLAPRS